jgi:exonuclease SbcD
MRVLCTGDLHIGRTPSKAADGPPDPAWSARAAWRSIVDLAIAERVDLLAISGDLVDADNAYFEAIGAVEEGVRKLRAAGIPVAAVAGNHDAGILPRIFDRVGDDSVRLLGRGQTWERWTLFGPDGSARLHVDGWSFASKHVAVDPIASRPNWADDGTPTLAIVHGDLDVPGSRYAPLTRAALQTRPVALWLLGHIHVPRLLTAPAAPPILYPGSPHALDPGETDVHGVWLIDLSQRDALPALVPLSPVRYDAVTLDVGGSATVDDALDRIRAGMRARLVAAASEHGGDRLRVLSLRVRVVGAVDWPAAALAARAADLRDADEWLGAARLCLDDLVFAVRRPHDLVALARVGDPPGAVAKLLLELQTDPPGDAARDLLRRAAGIASVTAAGPGFDQWTPVGEHEVDDHPGLAPDDATLHALVVAQAEALLDALLAQKEPAR